MMGAAARFGFQIDRSSGRPAFAGRPMPIACGVSIAHRPSPSSAVWMVVNLVTGLIGFAPGVDDAIAWEAHIGGFLAGFLCIDWFDRSHRGEQRRHVRTGSCSITYRSIRIADFSIHLKRAAPESTMASRAEDAGRKAGAD